MAGRTKQEVAQGDDGKATIDFRGLKLELRSDPGALALDAYSDFEEGQKQLSALRKLLRGYLGDEQYQVVLLKLQEDGLSTEDSSAALYEDGKGLLAQIGEVVGVDTGEASASDAS